MAYLNQRKILTKVLVKEQPLQGVTVQQLDDQEQGLIIDTGSKFYEIILEQGVNSNVNLKNSGTFALSGDSMRLVYHSGNVDAENLTPENIKKGVTILGIEGTCEGGSSKMYKHLITLGIVDGGENMIHFDIFSSSQNKLLSETPVVEEISSLIERYGGRLNCNGGVSGYSGYYAGVIETVDGSINIRMVALEDTTVIPQPNARFSLYPGDVINSINETIIEL